MALVKIECPSCFKKGSLEINEEIIRNSERGITGITVTEKFICNHSFVAYIDRNLVARDCFLVDFTVKLPEIKMNEVESSIGIDEYNDIDFYLISINVQANTLASIFRGIFLNQKIVFLNDISIVNSHLFKLLEYTFKEYFDYDISIISEKEYKKNRKLYKDYLVLSKNDIAIDNQKLLNEKKKKIENAIVQKFLSIPDIVSGLIVLKNEIFKAHKIALDAVNHYNGLSQKEQKKFSIFDLAEYINENVTTNFNIKLQKAYLDFLIDILIHYFKLDISEDAKTEDFLRYL